MAKYKATVALDRDLWARFQAVCALERVTASEVVDGLIREWLKRHEPKAAAALTASSRPKGPLP